MNSPYEYSLVKGKDGAWKVNSVSKLKKGAYSISKTARDSNAEVEIEINSVSGRKRLYFSDETDVEYPGEKGKMGGYAKVPKESISFVIDHAENDPKEIKVDRKVIYSKIVQQGKVNFF